jgi:hypothetical protein
MALREVCVSGISALNELRENQGLQLRRASSTRSATPAFLSLFGAVDDTRTRAIDRPSVLNLSFFSSFPSGGRQQSALEHLHGKR